MSGPGFAEALRMRGLQNAEYSCNDACDPDHRMLMCAIDTLLSQEPPPWSVQVRRLEPVQLAVSANEHWFDQHLSGVARSTPRDRARSAVARAFAAVVARMSSGSLKLKGEPRADTFASQDLELAFAQRLDAIRTLLKNQVDKGGYQRLQWIAGDTT